MEILHLIFITVFGLALIAMIYIVMAKPTTGNATIAALLSGGFAAYTVVQIYSEGVIMFWTNHTANLTGIQVWWDLVMCIVISLFFIAPRARAVGMNVPLWVLISASTASIGILAMIARLFWLEGQAEAMRKKSAQTKA